MPEEFDHHDHSRELKLNTNPSSCWSIFISITLQIPLLVSSGWKTYYNSAACLNNLTGELGFAFHLYPDMTFRAEVYMYTAFLSWSSLGSSLQTNDAEKEKALWPFSSSSLLLVSISNPKIRFERLKLWPRKEMQSARGRKASSWWIHSSRGKCRMSFICLQWD